MSFGIAMMKHAMADKGWSQSELARRCEVDRTTITKICSGVNQPSIKLAKKLGEMLEIEWMLFFTPIDEAVELLNLTDVEGC